MTHPIDWERLFSFCNVDLRAVVLLFIALLRRRFYGYMQMIKASNNTILQTILQS